MDPQDDPDRTGGDGLPIDWASTLFRGSFSRSNSPSPDGMLREDAHDLGSEHSHLDGTNIDQTLWETSSPSPERIPSEIEDTYMEDIITQLGTEGRSESAPFSAPKGGTRTHRTILTERVAKGSL